MSEIIREYRNQKKNIYEEDVLKSSEPREYAQAKAKAMNYLSAVGKHLRELETGEEKTTSPESYSE